MGLNKQRKGNKALIQTLRTTISESKREVAGMAGCTDVDAYERRYSKIGRKWGLMFGSTPPIVNKRK